MFQTTDLYLGTFLILSGFSLSLLNLKRVVNRHNMFSTMMLSENIILLCIGIAFIVRAVYNLKPASVPMSDMEDRTVDMILLGHEASCGYGTVFMSFGPLVIPFVNGFLSLVIDNYLHYKKLVEIKKRDEENVVQGVVFDSRQLNDVRIKLGSLWKKYFSSLVILLQWIIPILLTLFMYPMGVKEIVMGRQIQSKSDTCMAMMEITNSSCMEPFENFTELRKYTNKDYIKAYDNVENKDNLTVVNSVIDNVYNIVHNLSNYSLNITSATVYRKPKLNSSCMKICYMESKSMLLYIFILATVSFFIPVMISIFILTKIHVMDVQTPNKNIASRELLYNILFWTPVLFDSYVTQLYCAYTADGVRTSLFNVVANVYQVVKNFLNAKYFTENTVMPV